MHLFELRGTFNHLFPEFDFVLPPLPHSLDVVKHGHSSRELELLELMTHLIGFFIHSINLSHVFCTSLLLHCMNLVSTGLGGAANLILSIFIE